MGFNTLGKFEQTKDNTPTNIPTAEKIQEYKEKIDGYEEALNTYKQEWEQLKTEILAWQKQSVEKLKNGIVRIRYRKIDQQKQEIKWNLDIDPSKNTITLRQHTHIAALKKRGWKKHEALPINLSSKEKFLSDLTKILNQKLEKNRKNILSDAIRARSLIENKNTQKNTNKETKEYKETAMEKQKSRFWRYIAHNEKLQKFDKRNTFGRRIRTIRFHEEIRQSINNHTLKIPYADFMALTMVESEWNTASINTRDGWAWFIHRQPDVASKDYGMKIFTNNAKYKKYDFDAMKKKWNTRKTIYKTHGKILQQILKEGDGYNKLSNMDDRFHIPTCIEKTWQYLRSIYRWVKRRESKNSKRNLSTYKKWAKEAGIDFHRACAMNGFNKWPRRFLVNFTEWTHLNNIKGNKEDALKYEGILEAWIKKWLKDKELFNYILKNKG